MGAIDNMRIVCVGDSITRGVTWIHGGLHILRETYPKLLQAGLSMAGQAGVDRSDKEEVIEVVNRGVFNDNSDGLVRRLEKDVIALQPDVVVIEIGANDSTFHWDEVAKAPDEQHVAVVPLKRYLENMTKIVERVREAGGVPLVLTLLPTDPARYYMSIAKTYGKQIAHWIACCGGIEPWHRNYDEALQGLIAKLGVDFINLRTAYQSAPQEDAPLMSPDGIHLTAQGYEWLSNVVRDGLRSLDAWKSYLTPGTAQADPSGTLSPAP